MLQILCIHATNKTLKNAGYFNVGTRLLLFHYFSTKECISGASLCFVFILFIYIFWVCKLLDVNLHPFINRHFSPLNRCSEHFGSKATQAFGDKIIANEVSPCHRGKI